MLKLYISLLVASGLLVGCASVAKDNPWPENSFIILDETPGVYVFSPGLKDEPTVNRVVLMPVVENYLWSRKRHFLALADPIVVEPGKQTLRETMSCLETNRQAVRRCIILARGYCPGTLQPIINYGGEYEGKLVWRVVMAKVSDEQFNRTVQCITNELSASKLRIQGMRGVKFEDAIRDGTLLSNAELLSPVDGKYRKCYVLWSVPDGTEVSICLSTNGWNTLLRELVERESDLTRQQ